MPAPIPPSPCQQYAEIRPGVYTGIAKAQVYDMSDELEQFEDAAEEIAARGRVKPRGRTLNNAFEKNWWHRAAKFISRR